MVSGALAVLLEAGLITPAEDTESQAFAFRHALLQDAAYASLLRAERRGLHRTVGEILEADFTPAGALELAPRLAEHFQQAGDPPRARDYFTQAGDAAARRYANVEAIDHNRRALATGDPRELEPAALQHLLLQQGQALELSGRHGEALAGYQQLQDLAHERNAPEIEHTAVMARAKIYATLTPQQNPEQARALLEQALSDVRVRQDAAAESKVLWNLMVLLTWGGDDYLGAIAFGEQAVVLARQAGDRERLAFALNDLSYPYVATDRLGEALQVIEESRSIWRELGNHPMLVDNLSQAVLLHYDFGDLPAGEDCAVQAMRLSDEMGNIWGQTNSRLYYGHIALEQGRIDAAVETMRSAIRLGDVSHHPGALVGARTDLALVLTDLGAFDEAAELLDNAARHADQIGTGLRAYPMAAQARLALLQGERSAARDALVEARRFLRPAGLQWFAPILIPLLEGEVALAEGEVGSALSILTDLERKVAGMPARPFVPEVMRQRAAGLARSGSPNEAVAVLRHARLESESMGSTWRLLPVLVDLSRTLGGIGDQTEANKVLDEAKAVGHGIVAQLPEDRRWTPFRNRPEVQAVLAG